MLIYAKVSLIVEVWNLDTGEFKRFVPWSATAPLTTNPNDIFCLRVEYVEDGLWIKLYKNNVKVLDKTINREEYINPNDSCFLVGEGIGGVVRFLQFGVEVSITPIKMTLKIWQWDIRYFHNGY